MQVSARTTGSCNTAAYRVDDAQYAAALSLDLGNGRHRVIGFTRLADSKVQCIFLDERVFITKFCGRFRITWDTCQGFDHARSDTAGNKRAAATDDFDALYTEKLTGTQIEAIESSSCKALVNSSA